MTGFFKLPEKWIKYWQGMPEFSQDDQTGIQSIIVHFETRTDIEDFAKLINQTVTPKTKFLWYPKQQLNDDCNRIFYITKENVQPKYPVYIISKGRWENPLTAKALNDMAVNFKIVIEPQEYNQYAAAIDPDNILVLPFSNLGQGSIPARNWVWEHSIQAGHERHWIVDDNIYRFMRINHNGKHPVKSGIILKAMEDFVDRFENIGLAGPNYENFVHRREQRPAFQTNTRIYSCILVKNDLDFRWRGRYNEDTDLSLRILESGLCTVLFNAFTIKKVQTMVMRGGNTDNVYIDGDNRLKFAESLKQQHPKHVKVTKKWGRFHHHVDYSPFQKNELVLRPGINVQEGINDLGMELIRIKT